MHLVLLLAQLIATAHRPLAVADSVALHHRVDKTEFQFLMDWRYSWQLEMELVRVQRPDAKRPSPPNYDPRYQLKSPLGTCEPARIETDQHYWATHLPQTPITDTTHLCPSWSPPNWYEPADERKSIDASLSPDGFPTLAADTARLLRAPVLALLDSAAAQLPGDGWIAGQRVRLHIDATEIGAAMKAATDCRGEKWWCTALLAYVQYSSGAMSAAAATFDRSRAVMPDSIRCDWDNVGPLFSYTGEMAFRAMSCAQRDSVNQVVWWLADPLYIENGNERRTEHYARHVLIALHAALDADERFDWRPGNGGEEIAARTLKWGWPTELVTLSRPIRWHTGDIRANFLGDESVQVTRDLTVTSLINPEVLGTGQASSVTPGGFGSTASSIGDVLMGAAAKPPLETSQPGPTAPIPLAAPVGGRGVHYWGPQFHTVPLWSTVLDPYHAMDAGWDLSPPRDGPYFDTSWWAPEFYRRDSGPLVPLTTQAAFFRRENSAVLAAGMGWDTVAYLVGTPPPRMIGAAIISPSPFAPLSGARDTMSGRAPHALAALVPSGPAILSIEMVPNGTSGPSGRSRFGVEVPAPLHALPAGALALSDIVLTTAPDDLGAPETFVAMLPQMLGTTLLRDPKRVGLFWELYGLKTGDTVDVSLRIVRKDDGNVVQHLGALLGVGAKGDDSLAVRWTEPRPGDPTATFEGGVTVRPRGLALDLSAFDAGRYSVEVVVQHGNSPPVRTVRDFRIERK